ncbi:hypothetical protein [Sphingomonas cavernae]|nr:hypothetical protein [Sphingomonas cavernae]
MISWPDMLKILSKREESFEFKSFLRSCEETPSISETPVEYNDPQGHTVFYKFLLSGVEIGVRAGVVNHVHFYATSHEGYQPYKGLIGPYEASGWNEQLATELLRPPVKSGGGKPDALIGYVHRWMKFELDSFFLRFEFAPEGSLWKATIVR